MKLYVLQNKKVVLVDHIFEYLEIMDKIDINVQKTVFKKILVSSVFLGIDCSMDQQKKPRLFESQIFGGSYNGQKFLSTSWKNTLKKNSQLVKLVKKDYYEQMREGLILANKIIVEIGGIETI
jgi:hypothetical protein